MVTKKANTSPPTKKRAAWGSLSKTPAEIEIESNVPVPPPTRKDAKQYPFADMKIGDSFVVLKKDGGAARARAYKYGADHPGFKFTAREVPEGCRIWRIEDNRAVPKKNKK